MDDQRLRPNRLINEKSPYLLQHAHNPVDWYPWGEEAFERAKKEDKPVFLSIGYSTCHWCHVMEKESFEDDETARLMNAAFVSIKVDREERPDIDAVYMDYCRMMMGSGGWPLTIIMTAEKKPFFAGTYLPKHSNYGRIGLMELIPRIEELWNNRRSEVLDSAEKMTALLAQEISSGVAQGEVGRGSLQNAFEGLRKIFDGKNGGFGSKPKFPSPHNLLFLLRFWKYLGETEALRMVELTLERMQSGGIRDHLGGGFHRYSTDEYWCVPHFEKMLYDQAMLALAYTEAYEATKREDFRRTATETLDYVLRDLCAPEGGFYSAEDADSEGVEGKFYLWTREEIAGILSKKEADLVCKVFNVSETGNFNIEASGKTNGENVLFLSRPESGTAGERFPDEYSAKLSTSAREKLFRARLLRVRPRLDDKILTDWNGLTIAALARASQAFGEKRYGEAARKAAGFILNRLLTAEGKLLHRYRKGDTAIAGFQEDYAFFTWGLIELYETFFEEEYLKRAAALTDSLLNWFWDEERSGFFHVASDALDLPVRGKESADSAVPSGNSISYYNLLRLSSLTGNGSYMEMAKSAEAAFSQIINESPAAHCMFLSAASFSLFSCPRIVIVGNPFGADTEEMIRAVRSDFIPNKIVILKPEGTDLSGIAGTEPMPSLNGKSTAYICSDRSCKPPTTDAGEVVKLLR